MPDVYETPEERITRLERKVENLEAWAAKVAPILMALQERQRSKATDPTSALYDSIFKGLGRK